MPRPRKNATPPAASLEERLRSALVPVEEQPYPVPANWLWVRLGGITQIIGGGTPPSSHAEYYKNGTIPWLTPSDLSNYTSIYILRGERNITELGLKNSSAKLLPENTVCLSSRAPIGYVVIAGNELSTNQGFKNFLPASCYLPKYLYWYLKANKSLLESYSSGTTFLELSASKAGKVEFPLPPLAEQQRIVERIDALFARLDEAKARLEEVRDGHETRRAAILHKAFTGELTAQWRQQHGVALESWEEKTLGEVCEINPSRNTDTTLQNSTEVSFVPMNAVSEVTGSIKTCQTRNYGDVKSGYTCFCEGDVIFAKITPCMENGKSAIVGKLVNNIGFGSTEFYVLRCTIKLVNAFLHHLVRSKMFREQARAVMAGAVGQLRVPKSFLENYVVNVPQLPEQREIVRLLDSLLAREDRTHHAATQALEHIDLMKKAILANAFRGELGTNVPGEKGMATMPRDQKNAGSHQIS